jgi:peptidoglycan/xylan/chitin deacetylase (PgdA/CDA1 family)
VATTRRGVLRGALLGGAGVATGLAAAGRIRSLCGWDRPPVTGGYAAAADNLGAIAHPGVTVRYRVPTSEPLVAFTFDDGPAPRWTPMVLDLLAAAGVPATFFLVGSNLERNADLLKGRLGPHEVGNHSWSHPDLATLDLHQVTQQLTRTHEAIRQYTGRTPTLFRPPFGHLGGSTVLAADSMGYDLVLWSEAMHEKRFAGDPDAQARDIIDAVRPGSIVLAHDTGDERRLNTLRGLATMADGLRKRGFRMVTVSEMIAAADPVPAAGRI